MITASYILQANLYLLIFYGFYRLLLEKQTYFNFNRWYLVVSMLVSFALPIAREALLSNDSAVSINLELPAVTAAAAGAESFDWMYWLTVLYIAGAGVSAALFLSRLFILGKALYTNCFPNSSFSFFKLKHIEDEGAHLEIVQAHENTHVKELHSLDIILAELLVIIAWFNPAAYLYRKALRDVHEFIADRVASRQMGSASAYSTLLLSKALGVKELPLVHTFNGGAEIKTRIQMLQKDVSEISRRNYLMVIPFVAGIAIASACSIDSASKEEAIPAPERVSVDGITDFAGIDELPEFPGGMKGWAEFLMKNLKYPETAKKNKITGRVIASFVVEKDGRLNDIKIVRGVGGGLDEEALRVLESSPNWRPGQQGGRAVRVAYTMPINFALPGAKVSAATSTSPGTTASVEPVRTDLSNWRTYLASNLKYPAEARAKRVEGRVLVAFTLDKEGRVSNERVVRGVGSGLDEEALRLVKSAPMWKEAVQIMQSNTANITMPIEFKLDQAATQEN